ncbi:MAG: DMT family transporter [Microthrixaceae bacterium]
MPADHQGESTSDASAARGSLGEHALAPLGAAVLATGLWSIGNLIAVSAGLPGPQLAFWRTLFGAVIYGGIFMLRGGRYTKAAFRASALGGLAFGLSAVLFFSALKLTTVASATVIAALQPVLLLPYSTRRMGERVRAGRLALILVAVSGTVITVLGASDSSGDWSLKGDLLAFAGTVVGCAYFVGTKSARETLDTLQYQASALPIATLVALGGALVSGPGLDAPTVGALLAALAMTIVPGSGHLLMSWSQRHLEVSATATIALGVTVMSSLGAVVVYDQTLEPIQLVGMAIVLISLALFVRQTGRNAIDPAEVAVVPGE